MKSDQSLRSRASLDKNPPSPHILTNTNEGKLSEGTFTDEERSHRLGSWDQFEGTNT